MSSASTPNQVAVIVPVMPDMAGLGPLIGGFSAAGTADGRVLITPHNPKVTESQLLAALATVGTEVDTPDPGALAQAILDRLEAKAVISAADVVEFQADAAAP